MDLQEPNILEKNITSSLFKCINQERLEAFIEEYGDLIYLQYQSKKREPLSHLSNLMEAEIGLIKNICDYTKFCGTKWSRIWETSATRFPLNRC